MKEYVVHNETLYKIYFKFVRWMKQDSINLTSKNYYIFFDF